LYGLTTSDVATIVANLNGASSSTPGDVVDFSTTIYFAATDGGSSPELLKLSGGSVVGVGAGTSVATPSNLTKVGSSLYYTTPGSASSVDLWNLTSTGLTKVKNLATTPTNLTASAGSTPTKLFFAWNDGSHGNELWVSGGTLGTTNLVKDIVTTGSGNSNPSFLTNVGGVLFFTIQDATGGYQLWKSTDGT